jgi:ATPase subunit of ABC transporter with duplicated ATPase domains
MLFVEHDRWFVERVATRILDLGEFAPAESIPMKRFA